MPKPPLTQAQRAAIHGYEKGSIKAGLLTPEARAAYKAWLRELDEDCRAITKPYRNPAAAKH